MCFLVLFVSAPPMVPSNGADMVFFFSRAPSRSPRCSKLGSHLVGQQCAASHTAATHHGGSDTLRSGRPKSGTLLSVHAPPDSCLHAAPSSRRISVCHQFLTLAPVLSKSWLCGKSTVFTYEIGFLGMLRNRLQRSSLFFIKQTKHISAV